jgi:4-amino-4-deoxy-L-arabinose transferase-like glycosyltransferase
MQDRTQQLVLIGLILTLLACAALRASGVWFAYPLTIHPDERKVVGTALEVKRTGDLNPHFFNYPSLPIYTQAGLFRIVDATERALTGEPERRPPRIRYFIAARLLTVVLSVLTILAAFEIGRRLVSPTVGLTAAIFIGAAPLHVLNAFTATVDTPVAFWASLSLLMSIAIATGHRSLGTYTLAGVFTGLAIGCKYTAFLAVVPLLLAHCSGCRARREIVSRELVIALVLIPAAFLLTTPFAILDHASFVEDIRYEGRHYRSGHPGNEAAGSTSWGLYAGALAGHGYGIAPFVLAVVGLLRLLRREPWLAAILVSFPLLLFLFVGQYKVFFSRNVLACIPALAVLSAVGVAALVELVTRALTRWTPLSAARRRQLVVASGIIIVAASVAAPAARAVEQVRVQRLPDSRWISLQWIVNNLPDGAHVAREHYTPPLEHYGQRKGFEVTRLGYHFLTRPNARDMIEGVDFVILSSGDFQRFFDRPELYPDEVRAYREFFDRHSLVKEFVPDNTTLGGPHILIYSRHRTAEPPAVEPGSP